MLYACIAWAAAAVALFFGFRIHRGIARHASWPTTKGHVLEKRVGMVQKGYANVPIVRYEYDVDGKHYVGDNYFSEKGVGGDYRRMKNIVDETPDVVEVHYDPKDPSAAFLQLNSMGLAWLAFGISVVMAFFGLVYLFR